LGKLRLRFRAGDNLQLDPAFGQQWRAELPVAEVNGDQQHAAPAGLGRLEMLPAGQLVKLVVDRTSAVVAPEFGQREGELLEQLASRDGRDGSNPMNRRQQVFQDDPAARGA
jgi:hypothetical protein